MQANATEAGAVMPRGKNKQQVDPELEVVPGSRLHQFVEWLGGPGGDCMIVLDGACLAGLTQLTSTCFCRSTAGLLLVCGGSF